MDIPVKSPKFNSLKSPLNEFAVFFIRFNSNGLFFRKNSLRYTLDGNGGTFSFLKEERTIDICGHMVFYLTAWDIIPSHLPLLRS